MADHYDSQEEKASQTPDETRERFENLTPEQQKPSVTGRMSSGGRQGSRRSRARAQDGFPASC